MENDVREFMLSLLKKSISEDYVVIRRCAEGNQQGV